MIEHDFSQGPVRPLILRLAGPMIVAELVNALYSIVDRIYIGHIPVYGATAMAALGIATPILIFVSAFAQLFGMGGAPLCSIARGEGDGGRAERIMGTAFCLLVITGALLTAISLAFRTQALVLLGASKDTLPYADEYLRISLMGTPLMMISLGLNPFINAQGSTKIGMMSVAIGALINTILDPLFIFTLGMGVRGAALATLVAQGASALWVLGFLLSKRARMRLRPVHMRIDRALARRICALGASNFTMRVTECAVQIVCNRTLLHYGGDLYVTVMTIIGSVRQMVMLPLNGFVQGYQPVIGFNFGARRFDRVRECVRFAIRCCFLYAAAISALTLLLPGALIRAFGGEGEVLRVGIGAMRIYFGAFLFMFMQMAGQHSFVALGKSKQAVFFSLLRKAFIVLPLTLLLPRTGLGVDGVFWAEAISNVVGSSACFATFMLTVYKKMEGGAPVPSGALGGDIL